MHLKGAFEKLILAALCFAELRESVKRDGVEYIDITEAFGPLPGFVLVDRVNYHY